MNLDAIEAPSANISLPLNHSVQQANGAQFALMLSLIMESKASASAGVAAVTSQASAVAPTLSSSDFNIETTQGRSLQQGQVAHFNLLRSLYGERVTPADGALSVNQQTPGITDHVLQEIEQGQVVNPALGIEAEKVSLAA